MDRSAVPRLRDRADDEQIRHHASLRRATAWQAKLLARISCGRGILAPTGRDRNVAPTDQLTEHLRDVPPVDPRKHLGLISSITSAYVCDGSCWACQYRRSQRIAADELGDEFLEELVHAEQERGGFGSAGAGLQAGAGADGQREQTRRHALRGRPTQPDSRGKNAAPTTTEILRFAQNDDPCERYAFSRPVSCCRQDRSAESVFASGSGISMRQLSSGPVATESRSYELLMALKRSLRSSVMSASITSLRSPSRMAGRFWIVRLMRWSVTRFWGKL